MIHSNSSLHPVWHGARSVARRAWLSLTRLADRNYTAAKALYQLQLWLAERRTPNCLLVFQMGKVGSTSIVRSIKAAGWKFPIYQFHGLDPKYHAREEWLYRREFRRDPRRPRHLWTSQYFAWRLARPGPPGQAWKIISIVRDPVARNLSSFFQILELQLDWAAHEGRAVTNSDNVAELTQLFLEQVDWHDDPLNWFDVELKPFFGVDVYASPFPKEQAYGICAGERASALVLKLERLDEGALEGCKRFLGLDGLRLEKANVANVKSYGPTYQRFLASIRLPDSYLDRMYTSRFARHFYTEAELDGFRARWRGNSD
jgi:hypothetical protein